jgi:hypothetical protein
MVVCRSFRHPLTISEVLALSGSNCLVEEAFAHATLFLPCQKPSNDQEGFELTSIEEAAEEAARRANRSRGAKL